MTNLEKTLKRIEDLLTALVKVKLAETIKAQLKDKDYRTLYGLQGSFRLERCHARRGSPSGRFQVFGKNGKNVGSLSKMVRSIGGSYR